MTVAQRLHVYGCACLGQHDLMDEHWPQLGDADCGSSDSFCSISLIVSLVCGHVHIINLKLGLGSRLTGMGSPLVSCIERWKRTIRQSNRSLHRSIGP